jgi:hypothetical protein
VKGKWGYIEGTTWTCAGPEARVYTLNVCVNYSIVVSIADYGNDVVICLFIQAVAESVSELRVAGIFEGVVDDGVAVASMSAK